MESIKVIQALERIGRLQRLQSFDEWGLDTFKDYEANPDTKDFIITETYNNLFGFKITNNLGVKDRKILLLEAIIVHL